MSATAASASTAKRGMRAWSSEGRVGEVVVTTRAASKRKVDGTAHGTALNGRGLDIEDNVVTIRPSARTCSLGRAGVVSATLTREGTRGADK